MLSSTKTRKPRSLRLRRIKLRQPLPRNKSSNRLKKINKNKRKTLQLLMIPLMRKLTSSMLLQSKLTTPTSRRTRTSQPPRARRRSKASDLTM